MANCVRCGRKLAPLSFKRICPWCVQHEAAQRGEIGDDVPQPVIAAPWTRQRESAITLTQVLFGANLAVFLAMALASGTVMDFSGKTILAFGANYGPYTLSGDWWRLFTYMFLHGGLIHIAFNMWCLWDLGALAESLYGRWTFLCVYLLTGIAAGISSVGWNPGVLSVGASGAIFGLAGALISSFYLGEFSLPSFALRGTLTSLLFFAGFNLLFGRMFSGVDNAAHVGGLVSGLILGALIAKIAPQSDLSVHRVGVLSVVALAVLGSAWGVQRWRGGPMRFGRALEAFSENNPNRAIAQLEAIVRQNSNLAQGHFALGQAYFTQGKFPQAETEFKRVVELQPQQSAAWIDLGMAYLNERRPEEAKSVFEQALTRDANDPDAHYGMGLALAAGDKDQAAIAEFKSALQLGAQESGLYYDLGRSYAKLKMYDDAIAAFMKEKEKSGDDPEIESALADAYQAKGMMKEAADARNLAAQLKNSQPQ
jgi:membrane associated rhomboid family serine protease/Flp pilus assembly protein TadD